MRGSRIFSTLKVSSVGWPNTIAAAEQKGMLNFRAPANHSQVDITGDTVTFRGPRSRIFYTVIHA